MRSEDGVATMSKVRRRIVVLDDIAYLQARISHLSFIPMTSYIILLSTLQFERNIDIEIRRLKGQCILVGTILSWTAYKYLFNTYT